MDRRRTRFHGFSGVKPLRDVQDVDPFNARGGRLLLQAQV